ncbi:adenylate/guanylate cyclase domain-containing protein [uncultured Aquimarina sp.]|uniref:adenylate/guanylate cyclase domain-containing protein n=1 Tax=uncultured Aquimarina sp. TaxID=575652 RepID=UPI002612851D|nr:adenylate/guanylate cyclase domain-containing protein [uncultured Aquimarina sp.]
MRKANSTYYPKKEKQKLRMFLFFVSISFFLIGQAQSKVDGRKSIADSLLTISKQEVKKGDFDKALTSVENGLTIFKEIENDKSIGDCYNQIATIHYYQGEFYKALTNFEHSKSYFKKANFENGIASSTNNKGAIHYYLGNYSKALDHYKIAVKLHEQLNNEAQVAGTTQNIGNIYLILKDYTTAKKYYKIAEKIYRKTANEKALSLVLSSIGDIDLKEENYDAALLNFETSLELATKNEAKQTQAEVLFNIGKLYEVKNELEKSLIHYNQSLKISIETKSSLHESSALIALGSIKHKLGKKIEAIKKCESGLEIAKKVNSVSIQEEACKCLYDAYKSVNNSSKALLYNEQMYQLRDSLNLKQTSDKILNMEFEKKTILDSISNVEKERVLKRKHKEEVKKKEKQRNIFVVAVCFAIIIAFAILSRLNYVRKSKARLQVEKDRSEHLLHNILPEEVAEELKEKGYVDAQDFETASVLFTDFKSFTETASRLTPQELVEEINVCFKAFDEIMEQYQIEKIKTIGDAYMAAGGIPKPDVNAVKNTVLAAIEMQIFVAKRKLENEAKNKPAFDMRVGIHVGPIVAGIVGVKKFQYDVWGDTVNIASRMESNGAIGKVNISHKTYLLIKDQKDLVFDYRGEITAKGKGKLAMYFVTLHHLMSDQT